MKDLKLDKYPVLEENVVKQDMFLLNCRLCEFKKCCKKYKRGKRCSKCPKSKD